MAELTRTLQELRETPERDTLLPPSMMLRFDGEGEDGWELDWERRWERDWEEMGLGFDWA